MSGADAPDIRQLYERYGFRPLSNPGKLMEIAKPRLYIRET